MMKLKKRIISLLLCGTMLFSLCSQSVLAEASAQDSGVAVSASGLCEHHPEHDEDCGYTEGTEGTPCAHEHTDDCYTEVIDCTHEHDEDCYPQDGVSDNDATPSDAEKREPENCPHICDEDSGCITKELNCQHEHDDECGYAPATEGTPCGYVCEICAAEDSSNAAPEETATPSNAEKASAVERVQAMIDALPAAEELRNMSVEEQQAVYTELQTAYEAFETLTEEEQAQITGAKIFEELFAVFNGAINTLAETTVSIGTADQLIAFANRVNNGETSLNAELTADIDLSGKSCVRIGGSYYGTFNGNGHKISNYSYSDGLNTGFISSNYGTVKNLVISGTLTGDEGGFVRYNRGTVENCAVYLNINVTNFCNGGIAGSNSGTIRNCIYGGQISKSGESGAIVGWEQGGTVTNCYYIPQTSGVGAFGSGSGTAESKTADQFKSGEVTWLLNGNSSEGVWKQTIGSDNYPGFTGKTVYQHSNGQYSNTEEKYTITVQNDGHGSASASLTSAAVGTEITLTATPNTGYQFKAWEVVSGSVTITSDKFTMPAENVTVKATFEAATYTVTLNTNGGTIADGKNVANYTYGEGATLPTADDMTRTGYTFKGWYEDNSFSGSAVTEIGDSEAGNKIFYAKWEANTYTVALNANGGTISDGKDVTSYTYGEGATLPTTDDMTRTGHTFMGWYADSSFSGSAITEISGTETGNKSFYAKWEVNTYTVTLDANGGTIADGKDVTSYTYGEGAALPTTDDMTRTGYTFTGWYEDSDFSGSAVTEISSTETGDKTFYADWIRNTTPIIPGNTVRYIVEHYKADKDSDTGYALADTEYLAGEIGTTVTASPKTYDGFTYNAEKSTASGTLKKISSANDIVTLKLYYDVTATPITPGSTVRYIVEHYKADKDSDTGYALADTEYLAGEIGTTVTANPKTYDGFTYNAEKSTANGTLKAINSADDIVTLKLYYDVTATPIIPGSTVRYIVEHYKADKDSSTGYTLADTEYLAGEIGTTVTASPKTYDGFTYNAEKSTASGTLKAISSADDIVTLKLYYDETLYAVTVTGGTGTGEYTEGAAVTITATVPNGKKFVSWTIAPEVSFTSGSRDTATAVFTMPAEAVTITANFKSNSSGGSGGGDSDPAYYTLTFETNGGSSISAISAAYGKTVDLSGYAPTRDGYDFSGWYSDKELTQKITEIKLNGNKTVYAGWTKHNPGTGVTPFTDVSANDWFYDDVMFVYENGLMTGTSATTFSPYANTTRAQIAVIFWRLDGSPAVEGKNSFTDVEYGPGTAWYYDAATWAQQNGIMAGYGDGRFGPDDPVTREQLAAIFYRYAQAKGYDVTATGSLDRFTDQGGVSQWAQEAMKWAVGRGILNGRDNNLLDPQGTATRAEIAAMLHRFIESYNLSPAASTTGSGGNGDGTSGWVQRTKSPQTGDNSHTGLWLFTLCTSAGALTALLMFRRRDEEESRQPA